MQDRNKLYAFSVFGWSLTEGLPWMLEQAAISSGILADVPFEWLSVGFMVFIAGQLTQDMADRQSVNYGT